MQSILVPAGERITNSSFKDIKGHYYLSPLALSSSCQPKCDILLRPLLIIITDKIPEICSEYTDSVATHPLNTLQLW